MSWSSLVWYVTSAALTRRQHRLSSSTCSAFGMNLSDRGDAAGTRFHQTMQRRLHSIIVSLSCRGFRSLDDDERRRDDRRGFRYSCLIPRSDHAGLPFAVHACSNSRTRADISSPGCFTGCPHALRDVPLRWFTPAHGNRGRVWCILYNAPVNGQNIFHRRWRSPYTCCLSGEVSPRSFCGIGHLPASPDQPRPSRIG